ncbi:MAG: dicarboxylate/amino acid:cation symporter [Rhodothalassiaceae bacterium]
MLRRWFAITLWKRILGALLVGIVVGFVLGENAEAIGWVGTLFIRLIRMLVVPLIFFTLVAGVVALGDPAKLGSIGLKTFGLYLATTFFALIIGLTVAVVFRPGAGVDIPQDKSQELAEAQGLTERLLTIVPENPAEALATGDVLSIIFFAILLGIGILLIGERGRPIADIMDSGAEVMIRIVHLIMEVAPFGVLALVAVLVGTGGVEALIDVLGLALVVYGGCLVHILLVHGAIMCFVLKLPPLRFFQGALDAQLVAFSTSSSSATLPVTMSVAEDNLGVSKPVASSVLPLGSTINMDGTALYVGIVAVFTAQALGLDLAPADYGIIALTTTLVSIGTAAVPSASLFLLAGVLTTIGIPEASIGFVVGFLLAFDRPLDMMRTLVNVTGDLSVATAVAKWEGELDEASFRAPPVE